MELHVDICFVREGARACYASGGGLLQAATPHSAGVDLRACLDGPELVIPAGARATVPTGISVQPLSPLVAGFVYSRSGLGARDGLTVAQGVGVIDPDYTGEILVPLLNTSGQTRCIADGERIAQLIFQPFFRPYWREVAQLAPTARGSGAFGHSGR